MSTGLVIPFFATKPVGLSGLSNRVCHGSAWAGNHVEYESGRSSDASVLIFVLCWLVGLLMMDLNHYGKSLFDLNITLFIDLFRTGFIQGFGMGFVFVPLSTLTFMTLDQKYRNEGTAMYLVAKYR